ncbi:hypothetical protein TrLO_g14553 [Triparma laevis f. longispina]|uniref:Uncharacterized protein n=1 Tax=Triparma laevis f. longispina TaxID=1714387 RepID=A0A9W7L0K8_9STRA|nr:hypothetical protein TrLO_g14553 [Triparma laevis f. longispina]
MSPLTFFLLLLILVLSQSFHLPTSTPPSRSKLYLLNPLKPILTSIGLKPSTNTSVYFGILSAPSSEVNSIPLTLEQARSDLINIPINERQRRLNLGKLLIPSTFIISKFLPLTVFTVLPLIPVYYLSLGFYNSGREGL